MIPKRDRESGREEHNKEQRDLERVDPEEPEVSRHCGDRKKQRAHKKGANEPIDFVERYS